jgi:hypothetical protein
MLDNPVSPDDLRGFNRRLIDALEKLGVVYAIGGSVAAMIYSEPRLTIDVDLMIAASLDIVETSLPYGLPFNVIDGSLGAKADLYIAKSVGLDASAMARRRRLPWDTQSGAEAWFLSPEDVILYKLRYYRQGGEVSQKHPIDIAKMLGVMDSELDTAYIELWAKEIDVADLWQALWDEYQRK